MRVFCYGTLMRGFGNYERLLKGRAKFIKEASTTPNFTMLHLGGFPGVVGRGTHAIKGEIFEFDEKKKPEILTDLDRLEGHPSFYKRTPVILASGDEVEMYILQRAPHYSDSARTVASGDWREETGIRTK